MITLKRADSRWDASPLRWWPIRIYESDRKTANLVCSNGHAGIIDEHEIAADGTVTPSVVCTAAGCDFHDFVKLEGWEP